jgi:prolyl oligopeptidase
MLASIARLWNVRAVAHVLSALATACARVQPPPDPPPEPVHAEPAPILVESSDVNEFPKTRRQDLTETLHGQNISDPYRWLEAGSSAEVRAWVEAQNRMLETTLAHVPARAAIHTRLATLLEIGQVTQPAVRRTNKNSFFYFYTKREGKQNQPVLYVREGKSGDDRVLFDPNALSHDGTLSLDWYVPSQDGSLLAYGTSQGGSEESTLHVRDVASKQDLPDTIDRARYASVCWMPDGRRFFYSRFPAPGTVPDSEKSYHRKIYEHVLGRAADRDPLVFGQGRPMTDFPSCDISDNGRWLVVRVHQGWNKSELLIADTH